eukprot:415699-Pyramimonas_sp.AAC.1
MIQGMGYFKAHAGLGADPWNPREWLDLPHEGKRDLLEVPQQVDAELAWPEQTLIHVVAMTPKPPPGEYRPIALTPGPYRLW